MMDLTVEVSPDGFVPEGEEMVDSDGDGLPDDVVMYPFDPVPVEFLGHDELLVRHTRYDGADLVAMIGDSVRVDFEVVSEYGELPFEVVAYSMTSVGGEDVQRTEDSADMPESGNVALATVGSSLFQREQHASSAATLVSSEEVSSVESGVPQALSSTRSRRSAKQFGSTTKVNGNDPEGLNPLVEGLSPLIDGEDDTLPEVPSKSTSTEPSVDESTVSDASETGQADVQFASSHVRIPESGRELAHRGRRAKIDRSMTEFAIDNFMTEFAQNSFQS